MDVSARFGSSCVSVSSFTTDGRGRDVVWCGVSVGEGDAAARVRCGRKACTMFMRASGSLIGFATTCSMPRER